MPKKIIKYALVQEATQDAFNHMVERYLSEGYQPYGSPFACPKVERGRVIECICQAVVTYDE